MWSVGAVFVAVVVAVAALAFALGGRQSASAAVATAVDLGTADAFSVLSGQGVTNTGPSVLHLNLGTSPNPAVTGFPPGTVLGTIHAADAVADQAQSDLTTAYNAVAAQASDEQITDDLAGLTLTTGVYTASSTMGLTGELTLDAEGDPSAVFIFQVGSALDIASGSEVTLTNGAQACNVFWQVGSTATLGTDSDLKGTVLALTSITAATGADVEGRLLARNGSVTLDDNVITAPGCATGPSDTTDTATVTPTDATDTDTVTPTDATDTDIPTDATTDTTDGATDGATDDVDDDSSDAASPVETGTANQVTPVPTGFPDAGHGGSPGVNVVLIGGGVLTLALGAGLALWWRRQTATN